MWVRGELCERLRVRRVVWVGESEERVVWVGESEESYGSGWSEEGCVSG